jgi:hypothetical protein
MQRVDGFDAHVRRAFRNLQSVAAAAASIWTLR